MNAASTPLARTAAVAPAAIGAFEPGPPDVRSERILRIHGYADLAAVRPAIRRSAAAMAELARALCEPQVRFRQVPIAALHGDILALAGGTQLRCAAFAAHLAGCTEIVPFVLTAGPGLDSRVVALAEDGELLDALLLETAGWLCIEDATRQFKTALREEQLRRGHRITSRMGPGYSYRLSGGECMWPLEDQPALFSLFGNAPLPVTLMASCAMQPKMSRSGLFGVAPVSAVARQVDRAELHSVSPEGRPAPTHQR